MTHRCLAPSRACRRRRRGFSGDAAVQEIHTPCPRLPSCRTMTAGSRPRRSAPTCPRCRRRAGGARQAGRGGADHGRAVPAAGLGRQRRDAAGAGATSRPRPPAPRATRSAEARLHYFLINKGPWSRLDHNQPFVPGAPAKPEAANFYPAGRDEGRGREVARLAVAATRRRAATGFFTTIRRSDAGLHRRAVQHRVPGRAGARRRRCCARPRSSPREPTLKTFLTTRADAFLANDYYESDVAWMELDARSSRRSARTRSTRTSGSTTRRRSKPSSPCATRRSRRSCRRSAIICRSSRTTCRSIRASAIRKLGALAPIRVVNVVFAAGDGNRGVQTAAYNLPNDERVVREKGTKRVMLKNMQDAKFNDGPAADREGRAARRRPAEGRPFDAFFTHILMHELMHGLGPHNITVGGRADDGAAGAEGDLQRDRGGQGRHLGPVGAAAARRSANSSTRRSRRRCTRRSWRRRSDRSASASTRRTAAASRCS